MNTADYVVRLFLLNIVLTIIVIITIFVTPIIFLGGRFFWNRKNKR